MTLAYLYFMYAKVMSCFFYDPPDGRHEADPEMEEMFDEDFMRSFLPYHGVRERLSMLGTAIMNGHEDLVRLIILASITNTHVRERHPDLYETRHLYMLMYRLGFSAGTKRTLFRWVVSPNMIVREKSNSAHTILGAIIRHNSIEDMGVFLEAIEEMLKEDGLSECVTNMDLNCLEEYYPSREMKSFFVRKSNLKISGYSLLSKYQLYARECEGFVDYVRRNMAVLEINRDTIMDDTVTRFLCFCQRESIPVRRIGWRNFIQSWSMLLDARRILINQRIMKHLKGVDGLSSLYQSSYDCADPVERVMLLESASDYLPQSDFLDFLRAVQN